MNEYPIFGYATKRFNPLTGCTANCSVNGKNYCWARPFANRLKRMGIPAYQQDDPFAPTFHPERLGEPGKWRKPQVVACNFMGDWMDAGHSGNHLALFMGIVSKYPQHTFLTLTKNAFALSGYFRNWDRYPDNIYNGLTITSQQDTDEKLPMFMQTPGKKWLSLEPTCGPINLHKMAPRSVYKETPACGGTMRIYGTYLKFIDQVIIGAMSGPLAKKYPLQLEWVRQIIDDCAVAGAPCFVKQLHINGKISKEPAEWPPEFRVRQLAWGEK